MKIIIFGTGKAAEDLYENLDSSIEIVAICDNNSVKWGNTWKSTEIINPNRIATLEFDYVVIASMYNKEIYAQLRTYGIESDKITSILVDYINDLDEKHKVKRTLIDKILKKTKCKRITLITPGNKSCNSRALFDSAPKYIKDKYSLEIIKDSDVNVMGDYDVVISTILEGNFVVSKLYFELWHGFPIKKIGAYNDDMKAFKYLNDKITYFFSYGNLYTYIMSSLYSIDIKKFKTTGLPRNDKLYSDNKNRILNKYSLGGKKILVYAPTYRKNSKEKEGSIEGETIENYLNDFGKLNIYLKEKNMILYIKKHPLEVEFSEFKNYENISYLTDKNLEEDEIDFYDFLAFTDLLITDYSSIYIDYLLTKKPVVFWNKDLREYQNDRGFLFKDLDFILPGPQVQNVEHLVIQIDKLINNDNYYYRQRLDLTKILHDYSDHNSSERIWRIIDEEIDRYNKNIK